jgi:hypothetical protein
MQGTDSPRASGGHMALPTSWFQHGESDFGRLALRTVCK